jgi:hypothetical protein
VRPVALHDLTRRLLFERSLVVLALALGSGCARPDWIQQTLVTVDVTGAWVGSTMPRLVGGSSYEVRLELEQEGAKVKGNMVFIGTVGSTPPKGAIEGSVAGDVFRFQQTTGSLVGEMTVSGDEMKGSMTIGTPLPTTLRRIDTSSVPRRQ